MACQACAATRYPMCDDQLAQIDCRSRECVFNDNEHCTNVSPAISLYKTGVTCWTKLNFSDGGNPE